LLTRIGSNPARNQISTYHPARVTVAVITCIPHLEGYFRQRMEVMRLSLESILVHTTQPYDLLVFDNGSCPPVVDTLRELYDQGAIRFLVLSNENIGKIGAFRLLFPFAPGEIIAYSDDDILFYPGWLEAQMHLLEVFPRAGMVSGLPVRNGSRYAIRAHLSLMAQGSPGLAIERKRVIPDEWEADWARSTGRDPEASREALKDQHELVLCKDGVEAVGAANHFQFIAPRQVLLEALPKEWSGRLMGEMIELDEAIDHAGYLRLATMERYTRHIGNVISPDLLAEARSLGLDTGQSVAKTVPRRVHMLARLPGARRAMLALYNKLFKILNDIK
jgi:glycosyltransferase involved in cell wall biosynthesis